MQIYTLSAQERSEVWTQLTPDQKEVFNTYTMDRVTSELLTRSFRMSSHWRLISVNIDYGWEMRKKAGNKRGYQYCECGRKLKYQYELESVKNPKKHLLLGSTHFAEEAGIPTKIALEIQGRVNEIQIYMDEILYRYKHGDRFREERFGPLFKLGVFDEQTHFNTKMKAFRDAGLPLFHVDEHHAEILATKYTKPNAQEILSTERMVWSLDEIEEDKTKINEQRVHDEKIKLESNVKKYVMRRTGRNRTLFGKVTKQAAHHTMTLMGKYPDSHANDLTHWLPTSIALHGMPEQAWRIKNIFEFDQSNAWIREKKQKVAKPRVVNRQVLELEAAVWLDALGSGTPNYKWQLVQLRRTIACLQLSSKNGKTTTNARPVVRILENLTKYPDQYTPNAAKHIQYIYRAILLHNETANPDMLLDKAYTFFNVKPLLNN